MDARAGPTLLTTALSLARVKDVKVPMVAEYEILDS